MKETILIVEDEAKIASLLRDYLEKIGGYQTRWVDRGDEAIGVFDEVSPDLVLLDLMLPGMDGLEVCKAIRSKSQVPVIMVTALVEEIDRLPVLTPDLAINTRPEQGVQGQVTGYFFLKEHIEELSIFSKHSQN